MSGKPDTLLGIDVFCVNILGVPGHLLAGLAEHHGELLQREFRLPALEERDEAYRRRGGVETGTLCVATASD
jgi:hypothetical protein